MEISNPSSGLTRTTLFILIALGIAFVKCQYHEKNIATKVDKKVDTKMSLDNDPQHEDTSRRIHFEPNWESLDKRIAPTWYDDAKIGVFIHWGVYSVPSYGLTDTLGEWFWWDLDGSKRPEYVDFMKKNYPPGFKYQDFAPQLKGEFFNADEWADIVAESGAKYFLITSKHHDGFTLWKSNVSWNWNAVDNGPHRDILAELEKSFRSRTDVHFGLYHSLFEWFHPLYLLDKENGFKTQHYIKKVLFPQMYDYVTRYQPDYIWSDGDWEAGPEYWNSTGFLAWLYNDSPVRDKVLVNDRWGVGTACKHGDVKTCGTDRYNPGRKQDFKWENAMTIDHYSWGFRRNAKLDDYLTMYNLTEILAQTISCGGNLIMNIGPTADGRISPIFQERLREMGKWLKVNGEAIYSSKMWREQNDTEAGRTWYTQKDGNVYAILLDWPADGSLTLREPVPTDRTRVSMLGVDGELKWTIADFKSKSEISNSSGKQTAANAAVVAGKGILVNLNSISYKQMPSKYAWVLKFENVQ